MYLLLMVSIYDDVFRTQLVSKIKPETKWSTRGQMEGPKSWKIEPVYVAKYWEDSRIGVKG